MKFLIPTFDTSWSAFFKEQRELLEAIDEQLSARATAGEVIYPVREDIFKAFELTPRQAVKAVIVGQDPYHGEGEAQGFSFSVPNSVKRPPSLRNICKELESDLRLAPSINNDLSSWAREGVLLLNASLTVAKDSPASHKKVGWHPFTDAVITSLSREEKHIVFILWGKFAEEKASLIDQSKHKCIISAHPSPLSARRGFFGSMPFSKTNEFLQQHQRGAISWEIA